MGIRESGSLESTSDYSDHEVECMQRKVTWSFSAHVLDSARNLADKPY